MDRFFMTRVGAVAYLLDRRRACSEKIVATPNGNTALESQEMKLIDRLILDVRAGRIHKFELAHPRAVAIFISC
jgi:hypothetical protein